jgi:hypothetical protein
VRTNVTAEKQEAEMKREHRDASFEERCAHNRGNRRIAKGKTRRTWYERDPERLIQELDVLRGSYDEVFLCKSEDKNLVIVVGAETGFIALEAPHDYPMAPPRAFALSYQLGVAPGEDVEIDIFHTTGFIWNLGRNVRSAALAAEMALAISFDSTNRSLPKETG